ncbi:crotonase/enoyl-CoA hydratase family protein [Burkholderiaceae bacterium DAT-1]|nr:crotonase/enoyl-CoA hydratase family protein [Burkholderiaceae bacterium DAT-1]
MPHFATLEVTLESHVALIALNRPEKANAMNEAMWHDLHAAFKWVDTTPSVRVAILTGNGDIFCSGIDLSMAAGLQKAIGDDSIGHQSEKLHQLILSLQDSITSLEKCRKPVIAAIHGPCVGGGLDLVAAADFRYSTVDTYFQIKEIDLAMVADVGALQRLPHIIGEGYVREMAFTGKCLTAREADAIGLVNGFFDDPGTMMMRVMDIAAGIAQKSPLALRGIKQVLNYSRDHSVADGLQYVAAWNAGMLVSQDLEKAAMSIFLKEVPQFRD